MRKMNFINEMIYCLYKHYKNDLFQAKIVFSSILLLFFIPILYLIDKLLKLGIFKFSERPKLFINFSYIAIPFLIIVFLLTIKSNEIEEIKESEGEIFRKDGKTYLIIFLLITLIMWAARIFLFINYKY